MGRRSRRAGCTGIIATVLVVLLAVAGVLTTTSSSPSAAAATANGASTHVYDGAPNNASPRPVVEQVPVSADHRIDSRASPSPRTALALAASLVAAESESGRASELASACHSFAPTTFVVLADDTRKAISEVAVGRLCLRWLR